MKNSFYIILILITNFIFIECSKKSTDSIKNQTKFTNSQPLTIFKWKKFLDSDYKNNVKLNKYINDNNFATADIFITKQNIINKDYYFIAVVEAMGKLDYLYHVYILDENYKKFELFYGLASYNIYSYKNKNGHFLILSKGSRYEPYYYIIYQLRMKETKKVLKFCHGYGTQGLDPISFPGIDFYENNDIAFIDNEYSELKIRIDLDFEKKYCSDPELRKEIEAFYKKYQNKEITYEWNGEKYIADDNILEKIDKILKKFVRLEYGYRNENDITVNINGYKSK